MQNIEILNIYDGELVQDDELVGQQDGKNVFRRKVKPTFLVFDCLVVQEGGRPKNLMYLNFRNRLKAAEKYINYNHTSIRLYQQENKDKLDISKYNPKDPWIEIYMKDMFEVWEVSSLFKLIHSNYLMHENDGLIFTIDCVPYYPGTCEQIVKWKPPHMNTIDFKIQYLGDHLHSKIENKNDNPKVWGLFCRDGKDE